MKIKDIEKLIKLLDESSVNEIEIKSFGKYIRVSKVIRSNISQGETVIPISPSQVQKKIEEKPEIEKVQEKKEEVKVSKDKREGLVAIKAPLVGTFYRAPAPDAPPYVEVGDRVKKGQVLCIIEAMKIMNEIESDVDGTVVEILVKNEEPVEYGQELFLIKPD